MLSVLKRLKNAVRCKRPEFWSNNLWILHEHDDNAPSHRAGIVLRYLSERQINTIEWLPCPPDLASFDFCLFKKPSNYLFGKNIGVFGSDKKECDERSWKSYLHRPTKRVHGWVGEAYAYVCPCVFGWLFFEGNKISFFIIVTARSYSHVIYSCMLIFSIIYTSTDLPTFPLLPEHL